MHVLDILHTEFTDMAWHTCVCVLTDSVPPDSKSPGQSTDVHRLGTPHFHHTIQGMNIQTKTLTSMFNFEHSQELILL